MKKEKVMSCGNPYKDLANAIIICAANDYREALKTHSLSRVMELETFFRGQWIELLTDIDGSYLIRKIREEVDGSETI